MALTGDLATGLPSASPVNKVTASAAAGAVTAIVIWLLGAYAGIQIPDTVQSALIVLVTLAIGWLTPPGANEMVLAPPFGSGDRTA